MKTIILLVLLAGGAYLCRINLPPNDVSAHHVVSEDAGVLDQIKHGLLSSQAIAQWHYSDYGVVKFARSDRLDLTMIALPFQKWRVHKAGAAAVEK